MKLPSPLSASDWPSKYWTLRELEAVGVGRGSLSRAGQLAYVTAHDNECYGSMAVYMRLKGIVPPSTAARGGMGMGRGMSGGQGRGRQQ